MDEKMERTVRIVEGFDRLSEEKKIEYANSCFIEAIFSSLKNNVREYYLLEDQDKAQKLIEHFRTELDKYQKIGREDWANRSKQFEEALKSYQYGKGKDREKIYNLTVERVKRLYEEEFTDEQRKEHKTLYDNWLKGEQQFQELLKKVNIQNLKKTLNIKENKNAD